MLSVTKRVQYSETTQLIEAVCLSTDTKPTTGIANGSTIVEINTGKVYMFDEEGGEWDEIGSSGGGGGGGSSDFSMAEVTITTGTTEIYGSVPFVFGNPIEPTESDCTNAVALWTDMNEEFFRVPLYKGLCMISVEATANITVSTTGDITADGADDYYSLYIRGDGTITIS